MTYRRFQCGRCHRDLREVRESGTLFEGHRPITQADVERCPSCHAWYHGMAPFKAKRQGES